MRKPVVDNRDYRIFTLPENSLKVIVCSDPKADVAAAGISVNVGHFENPDDLPGLAHFLEHMLFMGTKEYSSENSFHEFLSKNNGLSNAYTQNETTNYYFQVNLDHLDEGLTRFASFFKSPLLKKDCVDRELQAVESEYTKNVAMDVWRCKEVLNENSDPNHPISRFTSGNLKTLKIPEIRDRVVEFFETFYSSDLMYLSVIGSEDVDTLSQMVEKHFNDVKKRSPERPNRTTKSPYFPKLQKQKVFQVESLAKQRKVKLFWPVMCDQKLEYRTTINMLNFVGHVLGHEGKGSLFHHLKRQHLASELLAGVFYRYENVVYFGVEIHMTESGEKKDLFQIIQLVYQALKMVKSASLEEKLAVFDDVKQIRDVNFEYQSKCKEVTYVQTLCEAIRKYADEDVLTRSECFYPFNEDGMEKCLNFLVPENMVVVHISSSADLFGELENQGKYFKGKYNVVDFPNDEFKSLYSPKEHQSLHFPNKNIFVPKDISIKQFGEKDVKKHPELIFESPKIEVFFKQDTKYKRPYSSIVVRLHFLDCIVSCRNNFLQLLVATMISKKLNEITYGTIFFPDNFSLFLPSLLDAYVCEFQYDLIGDKYGFLLDFVGFNDTIFLLVEMVLDEIFSMKFLENAEESFAIIKESVLRKFENTKNLFPVEQSLYESNYSLNATKQYHYKNFRTCTDLSLEETRRYYKSLITGNAIRATCLVLGNTKHDEIMKTFIPGLQKRIENFRPILPSEEIIRRICKLGPSETYFYSMLGENSQDKNNCAVKTIQFGRSDLKRDVMMDILNDFIYNSMFDELRNKKQLGYIVGSRVYKFRNVNFIQYYVQGEKFTPDEVLEHLNSFLLWFYENKLKTLTEEEFEKLKNELKKEYLMKFKALKDERVFYWNEINGGKELMKFDRKEGKLKILETVTTEDVLELYDRCVVKNCSSMNVRFYSNQEKYAGRKTDSGVHVTDVDKFRLSLETFKSF